MILIIQAFSLLVINNLIGYFKLDPEMSLLRRIVSLPGLRIAESEEGKNVSVGGSFLPE